MVNQEALNRLEELEKEYARTWGQPINHTLIPPGISQDKLVRVFEIMSGSRGI